MVGFESAADDEHGAHSPVLTGATFGVFPPNTLYRLKETVPAGEWVAPGGARPQQPLLVVTATYRSESAAAEQEGGGRMCVGVECAPLRLKPLQSHCFHQTASIEPLEPSDAP